MSIIAAALMLSLQPAVDFSAGRTATIFATIDRSEWCPAGNVQVDLVTGGFTLTPGAPRAICNDADVQRPVTKGQLDKAQLATLRAAYAAVQKGGLTQCGSGKTSDRIVVDNGGPAILVLTDGAKTVAAPDELSCWTAAARELGLTLDRTLGSRAGRGAPQTP